MSAARPVPAPQLVYVTARFTATDAPALQDLERLLFRFRDLTMAAWGGRHGRVSPSPTNLQRSDHASFPQHLLREVHFSSPLVIVVLLDPKFADDTAAMVVLMLLAERVFTLPLRIKVKRARLKLELQKARRELDEFERNYIDRYVDGFRRSTAPFEAEEFSIDETDDRPPAA